MNERVEHVEHSSCKCRRCKCVRFTGAIETLLKDGVPKTVVKAAAEVSDEGSGTMLTTEEYAMLFESQVRELHEELVLR